MVAPPQTQAAQKRPGTLSAFAYKAFAGLWTASLVYNLGNAIQGVAASWLMTTIADSADKIALVQTAVALPIMLFALLAGAVADLYERRRVILLAQLTMALCALGLALLVRAEMMTPWLLLALTFVMGSGAAFSAPAVQASIGDVVPRAELGGAVSLNILGFNVARSVGPALGGAIVAAAGASTAFFLNGATFLCSMILIALWKAPKRTPDPQREGVGRAIADGLQYVTFAAPIRAILVRAAAFTVCGSAAWALMPLVARDLVGGGAGEFGWLLGALGFGAVIGALASTSIRARFSNETILRAAGVIYGAACLVIALRPGFAATLLLLVIGGAGWVQALSGFSVTGQIWSPRWVVGRVAATINSVMYGGIALGSWGWGRITDEVGIATALTASGAAMIAIFLLGFLFRLPETQRVELDAIPRELPDLGGVDRDSGPIVITVEYRFDPADAAKFSALMAQRKAILRRDGARRWSLLQDLSDPGRWVERFQLPSWGDCVRHHQRMTKADAAVDAAIAALHRGSQAPKSSYMLAHRPGEAPNVTGTVIGEPALPAAD